MNNQPPYNQQPYNQPQYGQQQYNQQQFVQPQYGQQNLYGQQPMFSQQTINTPIKKSKLGLIIFISAAIILMFVGFYVIGRSIHKKGYSREYCENCTEKKLCKEYTMTAFGISNDYWVCDDCYPDVKRRADEIGAGLEPVK